MNGQCLTFSRTFWNLDFFFSFRLWIEAIVGRGFSPFAEVFLPVFLRSHFFLASASNDPGEPEASPSVDNL